jgi:hypothetical protein
LEFALGRTALSGRAFSGGAAFGLLLLAGRCLRAGIDGAAADGQQEAGQQCQDEQALDL